MPERLFKNVDACQDMVVEALKYHLLPDRRQSMYSRRTQPRKSYIGRLFAFGADDSGKHNNTPPTPTRLNFRVASRRRCVLNLQLVHD